MDVLSADYFYVGWYENIDGKGTFGLRQVIITDAGGATSAYAADLDGDGDLDVMFGSWDRIAWHENTDRFRTFGSQQIIATFGAEGHSLDAADVDGDSDMDVLYSRQVTYFGDFGWYKNTDGDSSMSLAKT